MQRHSRRMDIKPTNPCIQLKAILSEFHLQAIRCHNKELLRFSKGLILNYHLVCLQMLMEMYKRNDTGVFMVLWWYLPGFRATDVV
mmetsp:Transcript_28734/g.61866  ORF Transcript_28734/g.61866 Transcript_28734/m.61866 type:complete len:86 (+) Transcript_28734:262-519(+)